METFEMKGKNSIEFVERFPLKCQWKVVCKEWQKKYIFCFSAEVDVSHLPEEEQWIALTGGSRRLTYKKEFDTAWKAKAAYSLMEVLVSRIDWCDFLVDFLTWRQGSSFGDKAHALYYSLDVSLKFLKYADIKKNKGAATLLLAQYAGVFHRPDNVQKMKISSPLQRSVRYWNVKKNVYSYVMKDYVWDCRFDSWQPLPIKFPKKG